MLVAVRVLDALRTTSPSVGGPVDVYRITPEARRLLSERDIAKVRKRVVRWQEAENDLLDTLPKD